MLPTRSFNSSERPWNFRERVRKICNPLGCGKTEAGGNIWNWNKPLAKMDTLGTKYLPTACVTRTTTMRSVSLTTTIPTGFRNSKMCFLLQNGKEPYGTLHENYKTSMVLCSTPKVIPHVFALIASTRPPKISLKIFSPELLHTHPNSE
jgi:hypothetical protein